MFERYYVGSYWGPRMETALEAARRAELFVHMLARCDPTLTQWFRRGRSASRTSPGHLVRSDVTEWEKLFLRGRARSDFNKEILIEEFGFMGFVWNAKGADQTRLEFNLGAYSRGALNTCLFRPPEEGPNRERILSASVVTEVIKCIAIAWDPDFAMVSSTEMVRLIEKRGGEVRVGWLTYLSRRLGMVPPLPAPVRIEPVGTLGWLLTLSPERMTASDPEHVAFTARIRELLDRAGLLQRPEP